MSILEESGYFSSVRTGDESADLILQIDFRDEGTANLGMAVLTGLSLYLIPSSATDTWIADATVTATATGRAETLYLEESITQWQQIFLLPVMPFKATPLVAHRVQGNFWKALVTEIAESGIIQEAATRSASPPDTY